MAIVNLERANRDDDHALGMALFGTERALQTRGTDSPGGTLSCRLTGTTCFGLASSTFLQVMPLIDHGRSAAFRTAARYPATVAADGLTVCAAEVRLADTSTFLRLAVVRAQAISPLCGRFRAFCRAGPAPRSEPSCLTPVVSLYSQVPDVGLGHSRCWKKIFTRLLRSALFQMPLHSADSRSGPPTCWQRRPYEVTNRTGRAPGTRPDKHVTLTKPVCPHNVPWWLCRFDTPAPGKQHGLRVLDLDVPSGRLNHDSLGSISGLRQVRATTLLRNALSAGEDQAGPLTALLPTCHNHVPSRPLGPSRVFKRSCVCPACSVGNDLTPSNATASRVVSSQLLVALHTALAG